MTAQALTFYNRSWPNLQQTLEEAEVRNLLHADRRVQVRWALKKFTECLERNASELPAHQGFVIRQVKRLRRKPTGVARKSLSNMRVELLYLIKVVHGRQPRS